jgi:hypothetical protein
MSTNTPSSDIAFKASVKTQQERRRWFLVLRRMKARMSPMSSIVPSLIRWIQSWHRTIMG